MRAEFTDGRRRGSAHGSGDHGADVRVDPREKGNAVKKNETTAASGSVAAQAGGGRSGKGRRRGEESRQGWSSRVEW